ncbi:ABC transporter ATP-binding protein [Thomasclavelia saccharogumia]|uniref:ABC transporter ATP-binding protein n=1 Tax=Thomasclavelia saccharogumia TaxID=341225 RepID=UPI00047AF42C|nr:ABC transporter ATP-binding protein [Thomasclavelia saccharogumia]
MEELLKIDNVSKKYEHFKALDNVSLTLSKGKIIGLLGPNGSGKTTLIKIINGLLKEYDGEILVDGNKIGEKSRKIISYLPDENYFQDWMYVRDVLGIFSDLYEDFDKENCLSLMNRFKLDKNMKIKAMSKGMKEKFQLSLVMSRKAKIYILDEPIAGVDPAAREVILDVILNNYETDSLVLISTHLISDLETIFDEVIFLKEGKVVLHQETEELRTQRKQSIDEAFREVFRC